MRRDSDEQPVKLIWPPGMMGDDFAIFPMGYGYLMNQVPAAVIDLSLEPAKRASMLKGLDTARLVGISSWGFNLDAVNRLIADIRKNSDAIIVTGGPSATLAHGDIAVTREGEGAFRRTAAAVLAGDDIGSSTSTGLSQCGFAETDSPHQFEPDLDRLGFVDYGALRLNDYIHSGYKYWLYSLKDKFRSAPVMATRGCPYRCAFCQGPEIMGTRVRKHSIAYILETIERLHVDFNVRQISFLDDNLTFDMDYAKSLCLAISRLKSRKNYDFILSTSNGVRLNRLDDELLWLMRDAGWVEIVLAPESGSPATLERMGKHIDPAKVGEKVNMIHRHRMNAVGFFIYGFPGETPADLALTRDFILGAGFDRCVINAFTPIPGTPVYGRMADEAPITSPASPAGFNTFQYIPQGLAESDMRAFQAAVREQTRFRDKWIKDL